MPLANQTLARMENRRINVGKILSTPLTNLKTGCTRPKIPVFEFIEEQRLAWRAGTDQQLERGWTQAAGSQNTTSVVAYSVDRHTRLHRKFHMTESNSTTDENPETIALPAGSLPEELPPVQPPSAGYIIQLFLIPALIVAAVIGVWALFGKLADSETDWHQLVAELGSANENRRWRAALGLAQVLRNQQIAPDTNGVLLARQPEVAVALSDLLQESMDSKSTAVEDVRHQEFLARTLGSLEADDIVLPALARALAPHGHLELQDSNAIRKSSLMSLAMIAGRHFEAQAQTDGQKGAGDEVPALDAPLSMPTIAEESVTEQLRLAAQDPEPAVRHLAAFVLGLVSGRAAMEQLEAMLLDGDAMTRANAAVALARNGQVQGVPILLAMLTDGTTALSRPDFGKLTPEEQQLQLQHRQFEQPIILRNCIRAIEMLWPKIDEASQTELKAVLSELADNHTAADIRVQARALLNQM